MTMSVLPCLVATAPSYRPYPTSTSSASIRALPAIRGPLPSLFMGRKLVQREAPPCLFGFQPLLEGSPTLARLATRQQHLDADVLVQVCPVDALSAPMSSQWPRSSVVACTSRGYHDSGTEMSRPSDSCTARESSVTETVMASGTLMSVVETYIPLAPRPL